MRTTQHQCDNATKQLEAIMHHDFWHERWASNQIGFHEPVANPALVKHLDQLGADTGGRLFIPLCGKTLDIRWLMDKGYRVVGAELSKLAIDQLFTELGIAPQVTQQANLLHYQADRIDMFVGDIFNITAAMLGKVDAVYDRAALVALPPELRQRYTTHLMQITRSAPQLLICFEYDQSTMNGPPFSVDSNEVKRHYANTYDISRLDSGEVPGKLKGHVAMETVWLLKKKPRG
jgi:thiopurine S-methyltransferase